MVYRPVPRSSLGSFRSTHCAIHHNHPDSVRHGTMPPTDLHKTKVYAMEQYQNGTFNQHRYINNNRNKILKLILLLVCGQFSSETYILSYLLYNCHYGPQVKVTFSQTPVILFTVASLSRVEPVWVETTLDGDPLVETPRRETSLDEIP